VIKELGKPYYKQTMSFERSQMCHLWDDAWLESHIDTLSFRSKLHPKFRVLFILDDLLAALSADLVSHVGADETGIDGNNTLSTNL
jgi:hypothetical protein